MNNQHIKLVIFDLDGTLVDAFDAVTRSLNHTFRQVGYPLMSRKVVQRKVGWGESALIRSFVDEKDVPQALKIYRRHHRVALEKGVRFLPGAKSLLVNLHRQGFQLAIASNRPSRFTRIILKRLKVSRLFSEIICADQVPRKKPAPDMLKEILRRLKLKPKNAIYVGDMMIDIQAGRRARMQTMAISTGSCTRAELRSQKPGKLLKSIIDVRKNLAFTNGQKYVK